MYELSCPSCKHVLTSAFVRIGAVVSCPSCAHRYQIGPADVARNPSGRAESSPSETPESPAGATDPAGNQAESSPEDQMGIIGLSGLSEVMKKDAGKASASITAGPTSPTPPPTARRPASTQPTPQADRPHLARIIARKKVRLRRSRSMHILLGILVAAVAVLGAVIFVTATGQSKNSQLPSPAKADQGDAQQTAPTIPGPGVIDPALPIVPAHLMKPSPWQRIGQPYQHRANQDDSVVTLIDPIRSQDDQQRPLFSAWVHSPGPHVIAQATVQLSLLDNNDIELARTSIPVSLVGPNMPQPIELLLPGDLARDTQRIVHTIDVQQLLNDPIVIASSNIMVRPIGQGRQTILHLTTYNPLDAPLQRIVFMVKATDAQGQVISKWRVQWNHTVEPRQRVEFHAPAPLDPTLAVQYWTVSAVGEAP